MIVLYSTAGINRTEVVVSNLQVSQRGIDKTILSNVENRVTVS